MPGSDYATEADLVALVPDLLTTWSSATVTLWLGVTEGMIDPACWGEHTCNAHAFLTLHCLVSLPTGTAANPGSGAGFSNVTAKADMGASISFGGSGTSWTDPDDALLATTAWGRKYLLLREVLAPVFSAALARRHSRWPRTI